MSYLDTVNDKRQQNATATKEQQELAAMLGEMKKMQLAALMGAQGKSTVILTDQTDLGDRMSELADKVAATLERIDSRQLNGEQLTALRDLKKGMDALTRAVATKQPDNRDIIQAIKSLKLDPVITTPEPRVIVDSRPVDFGPLQATIREALAPRPSGEPDIAVPDRFDLSRYRAHDLSETDNYQYVGFVNPEGHWYIIENDLRNNRMRYVFGRGGFARHFRQASGYKYLPLDKAINATA